MDNEKIDKRQFNGGHQGSGRKTKVEEEKVKRLTYDAMVKVYGSEEAFFIHLVTESKESYSHLKLFMEYRYGKPRETKDINVDLPTIEIDANKWLNE